MHSPGRKDQEGDDRVCEGRAGMCGALFWARGSGKDLGVRISRQDSKVGIAVPDRLQRDEAGEAFSREQPHLIPHGNVSNSGICQWDNAVIQQIPGHRENNPWDRTQAAETLCWT